MILLPGKKKVSISETSEKEIDEVTFWEIYNTYCSLTFGSICCRGFYADFIVSTEIPVQRYFVKHCFVFQFDV